MKAKRKSKTKKYTGGIPTKLEHIPQVPWWALKKGNKFLAKGVRFSGIPDAYSDTAAWFAERVILALVCLATATFAFGVVFALYLSQPIAESAPYAFLANHAELAKEQLIDIASPIFGDLLAQNRQEKIEKQVFEKRKQDIKHYLITKGSPFAYDDAALVALASAKNMKLILGISFVESNFGRHCYFYNCSGIGGSAPNLKKYSSYADWVQDFDKLLEDHYNGVPIERFLGLYVQPGSPNWLYGVRKVLDEFKKDGIG